MFGQMLWSLMVISCLVCAVMFLRGRLSKQPQNTLLLLEGRPVDVLSCAPGSTVMVRFSGTGVHQFWVERSRLREVSESDWESETAQNLRETLAVLSAARSNS